MGKKARKTRWRALTLTDEFSDSETSSTTTAPGLREVFKTQKFSSNRYTYSSQSTPRRKYHYDGAKSTRSSSTTSENKMAFNEDDYTKISTPRQDVLFKKGYLNKPKSYNTQTSTGASTNSTGNSTGNGTPDYQSTDLEYESQFVFPNSFVDHNGFYYVNGYEYPFMFYNVPTYYPEYSNYRSKRYSSGSLTESTSPNNEEVTSQDLSGAEASNTHSDYSGHSHPHNHVNSHTPNCPNYHQNGISLTDGVTNVDYPVEGIRKIKKRRRRRTSSSEEDSTENSDGETNTKEQKITESHLIDSNENVIIKTTVESKEQNGKCSEVVYEGIEERLLPNLKDEINEKDQSTKLENQSLSVENETTTSINDPENTQNPGNDLKSTTHSETSTNQDEHSNQKDKIDNSKSHETSHYDTPNRTQKLDYSESSNNEEIVKLSESSHQEEELNSQISKQSEIKNPETKDQSHADRQTNLETSNMKQYLQDQQSSIPKYDLKPDAEEFVPRAYRTHDIPISPVQFVNISGNFVPIPLFPFNGQNFNPTFIPPGIPINFIPQDPKMFPNFMGFTHNGPLCNGNGDVYNEEHHYSEKTQSSDNNCDNSSTANNKKSEPEPIDKNNLSNKTIDIATVVSKLEVAAKEQEEKESSAINKTVPEENNGSGFRKYQRNQRLKNTLNYNGNYNNRSQNSPQREVRYRNRDLRHRNSSSVLNGETISSHTQRNISIQNFEGNHANSPSKQNIESPVNSSKTCSQLPQNVPINQSSLRKSNESHKKSPFRPNLSKLPTTTNTPLVATGSTTDVKTPPTVSPSETDSPNSSRRSPEKYKKVGKQANHTKSKWKQFETLSENGRKSLENKMIENGPTKNNFSPNRKISFSKMKEDLSKEIKNLTKTEASKLTNLPQETSDNIIRSPNQWISVQKRKKRKNKNVEEVDNFTDEEVDDIHNDQFESYDVNLLVDVVVLPEKEGAISLSKNDKLDGSKGQDQNIEEVLTVVIEAESAAMEEDTTSCVESKETSGIINNLENLQEVLQVNSSVNAVLTECQNLDDVLFSVDTKDEAEIVILKDKRKKVKKNSQKAPVKKVIIKDLDVSSQYKEIKEPMKKIVTKVEKPAVPSPSREDVVQNHCDETKLGGTIESIEKSEKETSTESINSNYQDEKKKPKKKKKKSSKVNDVSCDSDSILSSMEDTFDFLNSALSGETEDKTNDEISEELDKIIQKGMLNSIEEKIKSLNIDESDGFFKSVWTKLSRKDTSMGYTKIPDFKEILKPSSKSQLVSEEIDLQNKKCSEILQPDSIEPTTEDGLFLENPDLVEVLEDDQKAAMPSETVESVKEGIKLAKYEIETGEIEQPDTLYPITRAVKEWMCRTRETTPDVELLKSPSRIYLEFGDICESDSEIEMCDSIRKFSKELTPCSEITIFTTEREQSVEQQDLMEYWEDDVKANENMNVNNEYKHNEVKTSDEDEDEIPVYESQYGKNEDFLNIQRKIREQNENWSGSSQTHTSLPQRAAVCCNIM